MEEVVYSYISSSDDTFMEKMFEWMTTPQCWIIHHRKKNKIACDIDTLHKSVTRDEIIDILRIKFTQDKRNMKKFINTMKKYDITFNDKTDIHPTLYNIIGCPLSTDLDIVVVVPSLVVQDINKYNINLDKIISEIREIYPDKELDINYISLNTRGDITSVYKGSYETQNICFNTYKHHKQIHPPIFNNDIEISESDKSYKSIIQLITLKGNSINLLGKETYIELHDERKRVEVNTKLRVEYAYDILSKGLATAFTWKTSITRKDSKFVFNIIPNLRNDIISFMKSLLMKIIQTNQRREEIQVTYTKNELYQESHKWFSYPEGIRYFLMRGREGCAIAAKNSIPEIIKEVRKLIDEEHTINWNIVKLDTSSNPTNIDDELIAEFLKSPIKCSETFVSMFQKIYGNIFQLNKLFEFQSTPYNTLPSWLQSHVVDCNQRSEEWLSELKFYTCGMNTGLKEIDEKANIIIERYNLIRGCIMEEYAQSYLTENHNEILTHYGLTGFRPIDVGLLVKEKGNKESIGAAPDMLFINDNEEMIVVEIKTMKISFSENADYHRAVDLATKQCKSVKNITDHCIGGLLVILWITEDGWELYHNYFIL